MTLADLLPQLAASRLSVTCSSGSHPARPPVRGKGEQLFTVNGSIGMVPFDVPDLHSCWLHASRLGLAGRC